MLALQTRFSWFFLCTEIYNCIEAALHCCDSNCNLQWCNNWHRKALFTPSNGMTAQASCVQRMEQRNCHASSSNRMIHMCNTRTVCQQEVHVCSRQNREVLPQEMICLGCERTMHTDNVCLLQERCQLFCGALGVETHDMHADSFCCLC